MIGEAAYRLVRDAITVEVLEPLELKGKSERVAAYRVVDLAPDAQGWRDGSSRRSSAVR